MKQFFTGWICTIVIIFICALMGQALLQNKDMTDWGGAFFFAAMLSCIGWMMAATETRK
jgi:hypothetical protein